MTVSTVKFSQFVAASLANTTNRLVGVSAASGGVNFQTPFPFVWTTATRPSTPALGTQGYNSSLGQVEVWNGGSWIQLAAGGSGSVNLGAANELAWYAANGTAVSGLTGADSAILTTSASGVPGWSTTLPSGIILPQPIIEGVTDGSSASAGQVGEIISIVIPYASSISLTSGVPADITNITLTPGDWDVWGNVQINLGGTATVFDMWINTIPATVPDNSLLVGFGGSFTVGVGSPVPGFTKNVTTDTALYLSVTAAFSETATSCGGIYARRRR